MSARTRTFIEYLFPGTLFPETDAKEVTSRATPDALPEGAYGFRFYDVTETVVGGETLRGTAKQKSGTTYVGTAYTLDEVREQFPTSRILISNMQGNGWARAVRCVPGNWVPLEAGDAVLSPDSVRYERGAA